MPKTPVQVKSPKFNPFIVKSISKSLLTPCRQVGLSRKRKTPNSSNNSFFENSTVNTSLSSALETTPVSSNSLLTNTQNGSTVTPEQRGSTTAKKKARVSKRLITDDESSESSNLENVNKKQCLVDSQNEEPLILETKDNDFDMDEEVALSKKNKHSPKVSPMENESPVKLKKTPRKNKRGKILSDEEDTFYETNKNSKDTQDIKQISHNVEDFEKSGKHNVDKKQKEKSRVEKVSPKSKKGTTKRNKSKLSSGSKKKITVSLTRDDDDDFSKNNVDSLKNTQHLHQRSKSENCEEINVFDAVAEKAINAKDAQKNKTDSPKNNSSCEVKEDIADMSDNSNRDTEIKTHKKETKAEITSTSGTNHQKEDNKLAILKDVTNGQEPHSSTKSLISDHDYYVKSKNKTRKIKRSLSMKTSSSEDTDQHEDIALKDCLITLTPLDISNYTGDKPPSSEDVQNLEKQIKEKRKLLNDLKQADIYKKKHDLKELEELTARWKTGCILALNDLLPQVQTHATIDMPTLLKNINVPPEMIAISEDGNLI